MNFNSQEFSICYSRLGDSKEFLGRDFCVCGGSGWSSGFVGEVIWLENV